MIQFALAIFSGAFLLFSVQPMMGKYILPWFGGGTGVWSTCLLFFQIVLLAGYAYAHCSARWLRPRMQALVHSALVMAALFCLPVIPGPEWQPGAPANPNGQILLLLLATVGLPYFVLAATSPLLQHWFSRSKPGSTPYPLFALSNAASLAALASYPFLLEPLFSRKMQALIWSGGLGLYALAVAACAVLLWRSPAAPPESVQLPAEASPPPGVGVKLLWLLLSACASALMLAITNKVCLDLVVMPFLWVLPLALYLLSFIWSFAGAYARWWHGGALLVPLLLVVGVMFSPQAAPVQIPFYALALFYCCLVCHGELYQLRPAARHLTGFYLIIATGGAAGGAFVALGAPLIFHDYFELHWSLALVPVLMTVIHWREGGQFTVCGRSFSLWRVGVVVSVLFAVLLERQAAFSFRDRIGVVRNFYGVLKLSQMAPGTPHAALGLYCGTTLHGFQLVQPGPGVWSGLRAIGLGCQKANTSRGHQYPAVADF